MTNRPTHFLIGRITSPHGLAGEVRLQPLTDWPDRIRPGLDCFLTDAGQTTRQPVRIRSVRATGDRLLVLFEGVAGRDAAEALRGRFLSIDRKDAVSLPENSYYISDLLGSRVEDERGEPVGLLSDVLRTGANDVYVVERPGGLPDLLLPAIRQVILSIRVDEGRIVVRLPEDTA